MINRRNDSKVFAFKSICVFLRRHLFELVTRLASYADVLRARHAFLSGCEINSRRVLIRVCWKVRWNNFYCLTNREVVINKCLCELFNIFWCFRFENWHDNSVSINSIFIDKIDSSNSKIDNYRLLTPNAFIDFYRISKKIIDFYWLLSNVIDYRCYRLTTPG